MITTIIVAGIIFSALGVFILVNPEIIFGYLEEESNSLGIHILAVVIRLILGTFLLMYADVSKFPLVVGILGWVSIGAALTIAGMGRSNFAKLMDVILRYTASFRRISGVLVIVFGSFLVYAFL